MGFWLSTEAEIIEQQGLNTSKTDIKRLTDAWDVLRATSETNEQANAILNERIDPTISASDCKETPIHLACRAGMVDVIWHMWTVAVQNFLNVDVVDIEGATPMHYLVLTNSSQDLTRAAKALTNAHSRAHQVRSSDGDLPIDILERRLRTNIYNKAALEELAKYLLSLNMY